MKSYMVIFFALFSFGVMAADLVVTHVLNEAQYSTDGVTFIPIRVGVIVHENYQLRTGKNGLILMKLEGSTVKVTKDTSIKIEDLLKAKKGKRNTSFFMNYGNLLFDFDNGKKDQSLEIKTSYISLGVRGTKFFMYLTKENPIGGVSVLEGEVQVRKQDGSQVRLVAKNKSVLMNDDRDLSEAGYMDWQDKINWNLDAAKDLQHDEAVWSMIERSAYRNQKSAQSSNGGDFTEKALGLKDMFKVECEARDYEACAKYASLDNGMVSTLVDSCVNQSRYGCYQLGQLDEKTVKPYKNKIAGLNSDKSNEAIKALVDDCFQGNYKSCFVMGKRKDEAEKVNDAYQVQVALGHRKAVLLVLAKHCAAHNPVACGEFVRERMRDRQYAKDKGVSTEELANLAKQGEKFSSKVIGQSEVSKKSQELVSAQTEIICHFKEFPLLIKTGKGLCQAQVVCEVNEHKVEDLALCQARGTKCPDVYECILDNSLEVDLPENLEELSVLKR